MNFLNFGSKNVLSFNCSVISGFQASANMKKDAFSTLYEAIYKGSSGYDCTVRIILKALS